MQVTISNKGLAIVYFTRAKALFDKRTVELADCKTCDQQIKESYQRGSLFYAELIEQLSAEESI